MVPLGLSDKGKTDRKVKKQAGNCELHPKSWIRNPVKEGVEIYRKPETG